jgi:branched-chain amino acid transport system permease protein
MDVLLQQLVNGVALGSVYALIAIGFTLIFGVLRLLNMAHGEIYTLGAYLAYAGVVSLSWSPWVALPLAVLAVFILAIGIEKTAFKPLRDAPHFIPLVSTIAVSTILLELIRIAYGPYMFGFESIVPATSFDFGPLRVNLTQGFLLAVSLSATAAVQVFLKYSKWGKAIRAVSQDLVVGRLLGINVDRVIALTFALGSALGAVAGILIAMYVGAMYPDMGFVALVKAFTAAILGGMGSVPGAVLGGFVLGIVEGLGSAYLPSGFSDALPYAVLFFVLLFLPEGLIRAKAAQDVGGHQAIGHLGTGLMERLLGHWREWANPNAIAVALALITVVVTPLLGEYAQRILFQIALYAFMALGTNLVLGLAGQLSLAHAAFFAIGAYSSAILTTRVGLEFWSGLAVGAVIAFVAGMAVSLVTFRVRGYYLALVTLAFAEIVRVIISYWIDLTRGMMGIRGIPPITIGPWELSSPLAMFYLALAFCIGGTAVYQAITYSTIGRGLLALRDDELAARSTGLDTQRLKIVAFAVGAVYASCGGSIAAHYYTAITPDLASLHETVAILVILVVGGLGSAAGAVFGSTVVNLLPEIFRGFGDYRLLAYGVILFLMILYQPQGVFSIGRRLARTA